MEALLKDFKEKLIQEDRRNKTLLSLLGDSSLLKPFNNFSEDMWHPTELKPIVGDKVRYVNNQVLVDNFRTKLIAFYLFRERSEFIHKNCISYKPGFNYINEVYKIRKELKYGYKLDIAGFFDNVQYEDIVELIKKLQLNTDLEKSLISRYNINQFEYTESTKPVGLLQGVATSAFLADALLYNLDLTMSSNCLGYYRYCDDILFYCETKEEADKQLNIIKLLLSSYDLEIKESKTLSINRDADFTFIGAHFKHDRSSEVIIDADHKTYRKAYIKVKAICKKYDNTVAAIKHIQKYLFHGDYNLMEYLFKLNVPSSSISEFNETIINYILKSITGRYNRKYNFSKKINLYEMGWVDLQDIYYYYRHNSKMKYTFKVRSLLDFKTAEDIIMIDYNQMNDIMKLSRYKAQISVTDKVIKYRKKYYKCFNPLSLESLDFIGRDKNWDFIYITQDKIMEV